MENSKNNNFFRLFRTILRSWKNVRDRLALSMGVDEERKTSIYKDLSISVSLKDAVYWLQIFLSAGITALGLVQNSVAVIIGAMLISPLMGPILAGGLALATGDLILAVRSFVNLLLSTAGAIIFALILIAILPFKEPTVEILGRTAPNTLDLGIALFSGLIGAVATARKARGIEISIPGVAIAVALMPPLCVVGFGIGVALSFDFDGGMEIAKGGGLLYLTNLVAITFMSMLVFIMLRIDTSKVREQVREWRDSHSESVKWQNFIDHIPTLEKARTIRSFSLRLLMVLLPLLLIFIPLSQSFSELKAQYIEKQFENRIAAEAEDIWEKNYQIDTDGISRSYMDELDVRRLDNGQVEIFLRVFDNAPYSEEEKDEYLKLLATRLERPRDSLSLQLIEIPTSERSRIINQTVKTEKPPPPSLAELQARYLQSIKSSLTGVTFPQFASLLDYRVVNSPENIVNLEVYYLSERDIGEDAKEVITKNIEDRLKVNNLDVLFFRIPVENQNIEFVNNRAELRSRETNPLDETGKFLQTHPRLSLEVILKPGRDEEIIAQRKDTIRNYMKENWKIDKDRITFAGSEDETKPDSYRIFLAENKAEKENAN